MKANTQLWWGLRIMIALVWLMASVIVISAQSADTSPVTTSDRQTAEVADLAEVKFDLIDPTQGWVATRTHLFSAGFEGGDWKEITPNALALPIAEAKFVSPEKGWVIGLKREPTLTSAEVFTTSDGGSSWTNQGNGLQAALTKSETPLASEVKSDLHSDGSGWVLFKHATSSNFSMGSLFYTADWGRNWELRSAASSERFVFANPLVGYQLSAHGSELMMTRDGAKTWQSVPIKLSAGLQDADIRVDLPQQTKKGWLVMPVYVYQDEVLTQTYLFESRDEGLSWEQNKTSLEPKQELLKGEKVFQSLNSDGELSQWPPVVMVAPEQGDAKSAMAELPINQLVLASISSVHENKAWGLFTGGGCGEGTADHKAVCMRAQVIGATVDGGASWKLVTLPEQVVMVAETEPVFLETKEVPVEKDDESAMAVPNEAVNWQLVTGQGFDSCASVNLARMATWKANSPYSVYGLYLGGSSAYCPTSFSAADLRELYSKGWRFIPTWVGPQAPCTNFRKRFSLDPAIAYAEGVDNANQAINAARQLGLTKSDGSGTVIYYDLEYFNADAACSEAAKAFIRGWTTRLQGMGNKSGIYATSGNLNTNKIYALSPAPDAAWIAEWYLEPYYRPWVTVFDVDYLPDTYWSNHQRVYQYCGGHNETWGGLTLNIDNDVIDGPVAVPNGPDNTPPVSSVTLSGTIGSDNWYTSSVSATLTAADASGIKAIYYNLNSAGWVEYTEQISVLTDGSHTLQYRAVDKADNWETAKSISFKIDSIPPGFPTDLQHRCPYPGLTQAFCNDEDFSWTAAVDNMSGMKATYWYWGTDPDGESSNLASTSYDPAPIADETTCYLRFKTIDNAGNTAGWRTRYVLSYDTQFTNLMIFPLVFK